MNRDAKGCRVNVGCGRTPTPGWVNVDNSISVRLAAFPRAAGLLAKAGVLGREQYRFVLDAGMAGIRWADACNIPVADGCADVVYSSHMLEHLDRVQACEFLREVMRVLREGGTVRIAVPDIRRHAERYLESGDADAFVQRTHLVRERPRSIVEAVKGCLVGPRHHQWMYDGRSLKRLLQHEGFVNATEYDAGQTGILDPGALDLREREDESVYVEAMKAGPKE